MFGNETNRKTGPRFRLWGKRAKPGQADTTEHGGAVPGMINIGWDGSKRMNQPDSKWTEKPKRRGLFSGINGFISTCLLLALLLYGGVYIIGLMDGFRAFVEDHIKTDLDLRVRITKAWLTPALNLQFEGLTTEGYGRKGMPGLQIQHGYIEWSVHDAGNWHLPRVRRAICNGVGVVFVPDDSGNWEPAPLAAIGQQVADWCNFKVAAPKPEKSLSNLDPKQSASSKPAVNVLADLRKTLLEVTDIRLVWSDMDGTELAVVNKARMVMTPLTLPSREIMHYWLRVDEVSLADGRRARDIRCEFFDLGDQKQTIEFSANWMRGLAVTNHPAAAPIVTNQATALP